MIEENLEVKFPTIESAGWKSQKGEAERRERQSREKVRRKKTQAGKGSKITSHTIFQMICGSGGLKSRLAGHTRDKTLHAVVGTKHVSKSKVLIFFGN